MNCQSFESLFELIKPYTLSIVSCYLVSIFHLEEYRDANEIVYNTSKIRRWFRIWCGMLSSYSAMAFIGMTPQAIELGRSSSWISAKGTNDWRSKPDCCFWVMTFFLSKFIELGDTYFVIFLNRRLMLLQWFHHMTTLLYVQHALIERRFSSFWFIYMNVFVHSIMYFYYAKPCIYPWLITFLQILQMIGGLSIVLVDHQNGFDIYGFTMYTIYFYLFSLYFFERYIYKRRRE